MPGTFSKEKSRFDEAIQVIDRFSPGHPDFSLEFARPQPRNLASRARRVAARDSRASGSSSIDHV